MFLIDNSDNLKIPNFLQALGFIPPAGLGVEEIYINDVDAPQVDKILSNSGFEAVAVNPQYRSVRYKRKDPKVSHSFSDNYVVPESTAALAEFPKHIQSLGKIPDGQPTPQYKMLKSPVKAVTILEGNENFMVRIEEDRQILPKGSVIKLTEEKAEPGVIAKAAIIAVMFANDLKMMHHHAAGTEFDKIHKITDELYDEMFTEADEIAEIAIGKGEGMPNASEIKSYVDENEWDPLTEESVTWPVFVDELAKRGEKYLSYLEGIKGESALIDDYCHFWQQEINYKNAARALDDGPMEADYIDILDETEKEKEAELDAEAAELSDDVVDMFTYNDAYVNNSSWKGFEPMSNDMVVAQGDNPAEEDEEKSDEFDFDDVEEEEEKDE